MAPTMKRGLLRLALILMILWNLFLLCFVFKSVVDERSSKIFAAYENKSICMKSKSYPVCNAEYEAYVRGYSLWAEFKKQFEPSSMAIVELFPPVAIGLLWGVLWCIGSTVTWVLRGFGIQLKRPQTVDAPTLVERFRGAGRWVIAPRNLLAVAVGLVALAVSYYFVVSLPASNRERLQFEKDSAAAAKAERDSKGEEVAQATRDREMSFISCSADADTDYWSYVKLNGKEIPGKRGAYTAPTFVWNMADKRKLEALAECHRQYDPKK
jgi:hypothetical protein